MKEKLTLDEKIRLVTGSDWWRTVAVEEKGLSSVFMSDGPHGLRVQIDSGDHLGLNKSINTVCYPAESIISSSFNKELLFKYGEVIGKEALSLSVDMLLGPGVNIKRNPKCGRNFEYYAEDPVVSGKLGSEFIKGLQSVGVSACVKHFVCNNTENKRNYSDSRVNERTLREVYLKPFEICVKEAHPDALMCSYNLVNGTYMSENKRLLTDILKKEWRYSGIVVSDWGAVKSRSVSLRSGLDLEMPYSECSYNDVKKALEDGSLRESDLDKAVERMISFIKKSEEKRSKRTLYSFSRDEAREYSREVVSESVVLLKNKENFFPLKREEKLLIVGEVAKKPHYQGGGSAHIDNDSVLSFCDILKERNINFDYKEGYILEKNTTEDVDPSSYDKVLFVVGNKKSDESEGFDRDTLSLPECVNTLLENTLKKCKSSGLLIFTGGVVTLPFEKNCNGVMYAGLPGEYGCEGVVDVVMGDVSPSGKLTETWIKKEEDATTYLSCISNEKTVEYNEGVFVGYKYYESKNIKPLFEFGHGLSYTKFKYSNAKIEKENDNFKITFKIKNIGKMDGKETAFLFVTYPLTSEPRSYKSLLDFTKVSLKTGEEKEVMFLIKKEDLTVYNEDGKEYIPFGEYTFTLSSSLSSSEAVLKGEIDGKRDEVTLFTLVDDIWNDKERRQILEEIVIKKLLVAFRMNEIPEDKKKIILSLPLYSLCGLAKGVISEEDKKLLLERLNEV